MKHKNWFFYVFIPIMVCVIQSCGVYNSNSIFTISKKSSFPIDSITCAQNSSQKLKSGDRISFSFSTNNGEKIVLNMGGIEVGNKTNPSSSNLILDYLVQDNGMVTLPVLGDVKIEGLSIPETESKLEDLLKPNYQDPFVQIKLTNQRILVFTSKGIGQVVPLTNSNTTLLEVIAMAGGIKEFSKSNSIRLARDIGGKRKIYLVDLSKIENIQNADITVQNGDIIYIDHHPRKANNVLREATPWLSILSSSLAIYTFLIK